MKNPIVAEIAAVFTLAMLGIWLSTTSITLAVILIGIALGIIILSWCLRKENRDGMGRIEAIGLGRWENWKLVHLNFSHSIKLLICVVVAIIVMVMLGFVLHPLALTSQSDLKIKMLSLFAEYFLFGWAAFQQLIFQGYFTNRIGSICKKDWGAAFVAGTIFAVIHLPNPALTIGTFFFGVGSAYFFLKTRNLYLLIIAQSILVPVIKYVIAKGLIDHAMRVGPAYWQ